ncbi:ABC transporter permease [Arthrobacter tumbae]|uniref:ABC transporter permease n=1 Tax=Arthrobacter tumbae TaxID=163874 RepID=UPI001EF91621|nr:ABC transporter permease [Arthrobacter tumbae]MBM7782538.1 teichoic acid transport system permease protein [Arthrobacter tumbae]
MSQSDSRLPLPGPAAIQSMPIDTRGLIRVGARPGFLDYLIQLWDHRQFVFYDAKARVQSGNRRDRLGSAWLVLNPVFNGLTFFLIFGLLLGTGRGIENFVGYLIIGVFIFQMSSRAITNGARSIQGNRAVIQAFNFPRATLPVAVNLRELLAGIPVILSMLVLVLLLPPTEGITFLWLLIIPALLLQTLFNLGVGMILARIISTVNDVTHLLNFAMRVWMYGSGVFFSFDSYIEDKTLLAIVELNPLYVVLNIIRDCVLYATVPEWQSWAILTVWGLAAVVVGFIYFWKAEESYGRE